MTPIQTKSFMGDSDQYMDGLEIVGLTCLENSD